MARLIGATLAAAAAVAAAMWWITYDPPVIVNPNAPEWWACTQQAIDRAPTPPDCYPERITR